MSGDISGAPAAAPAPAATPAAPAPAGGGDSSSTPSAPRSTAEIAATVIDRSENPPDSGDDDLQVTPADAERFTDEEKLLRDSGFKRAKKADGTEHFIPRSKVLQIIANGRKQEREHRERIEQEAAQLREFRDGFARHLSGPEDQFLAYISQHDPRYRRFLEARQEAAQHAPAQRQPATDEPQPDIDLGGGQATFSPAGLAKWVDWAVEQRLDQRLAPIAEEREQARRQQAAADHRAMLQGRVKEQLTTAQTWTNWGDYEGDILKKLQDDTASAERAGKRPQMSLREAYLEVKAERLEASVDPARVREKLVADINAAPRSTALRGNGEIPRTAATRTTADIARAIIERGERSR